MMRAVCLAIFLTLWVSPGARAEDPGEGLGEIRFMYDEELGSERPGKPVRIKLKRSVEGEYSWEISGDDPRMVTEADSALRRYVKQKR